MNPTPSSQPPTHCRQRNSPNPSFVYASKPCNPDRPSRLVSNPLGLKESSSNASRAGNSSGVGVTSTQSKVNPPVPKTASLAMTTPLPDERSTEISKFLTRANSDKTSQAIAKAPSPRPCIGKSVVDSNRFSFGIGEEPGLNELCSDGHSSGPDNIYLGSQSSRLIDEVDRLRAALQAANAESEKTKEQLRNLKKEYERVVFINSEIGNQLTCKTKEVEALTKELALRRLPLDNAKQNQEPTQRWGQPAKEPFQPPLQTGGPRNIRQNSVDIATLKHTDYLRVHQPLHNITNFNLTDVAKTHFKVDPSSLGVDRAPQRSHQSFERLGKDREGISPVKGENLRSFLKSIETESKKGESERTVSVKRYLIRGNNRELISEDRAASDVYAQFNSRTQSDSQRGLADPVGESSSAQMIVRRP